MKPTLELVAQFTPLAPVPFSLLLLALLDWPRPWTLRGALRTVRLLAVFLGLIAAMYAAWGIASWVRPWTVDLYLRAIDGALFRVQPADVFAAILARHHALEVLTVLAYNCAFPACALLLYDRHASRAALRDCAVAAVLGWICYLVVPACGPRYVPAGTDPTPHLLALARALPRNGFPSMHLAWALLLWLHRRQWSGTVRLLVWIYLPWTAFATLAVREHYAIDLLAAVPLALAVYAYTERVVAYVRPIRPAGIDGARAEAWLREVTTQ